MWSVWMSVWALMCLPLLYNIWVRSVPRLTRPFLSSDHRSASIAAKVSLSQLSFLCPSSSKLVLPVTILSITRRRVYVCVWVAGRPTYAEVWQHWNTLPKSRAATVAGHYTHSPVCNKLNTVSILSRPSDCDAGGDGAGRPSYGKSIPGLWNRG